MNFLLRKILSRGMKSWLFWKGNQWCPINREGEIEEWKNVEIVEQRLFHIFFGF